jgi:hypothetical protein
VAWNDEIKAYGPHFLAEATVAETVCLDMIQHFLEHQIFQDDILETVILQLDEAPYHYARTAQKYLNIFSESVN